MDLIATIIDEDEFYAAYRNILASVNLQIKRWIVSHQSPNAMRRILARHRDHVRNGGSKADMVIIDANNAWINSI